MTFADAFSGKVLKRELREPYWKDKQRRIWPGMERTVLS